MISRSLALSSLALALLCSAVSALRVAPDQAQEERELRPNILFAIADDWGFPHASAYGAPVIQTPVFDRVAREGLLFEQAYISSPSCTPSRAAIVTGQWHWRLKESANLHSTLRAEIPVYPDILKAAGYHVGYSRKGWGPGRHKAGGRGQNPAGKSYKDFESFLKERPEGAPFCFWFGSYDPHRGYVRDSGEKSGMKLDEIELFECFPDVPEVRGDVADYFLEVQRFDREVGELLEQLEDSGELDQTLVVITGDHGMPFPRCKSNLYDTGTRVPLAMRWPGKIPKGRRSLEFVSLTDLAPTFLEIAGLRVPEVMTGRSLMPIMGGTSQGLAEQKRDHVLLGKERHCPCQEAPDAGGYPCRALRTREFLYIHNFSPERWPAGTPHHERAYKRDAWLGDCDNGPTKSYLWDHREDPQIAGLYQASFGKRPTRELYHLGRDPGQMHNLAGDPEYAETLVALEQQLMDELRASGDPRLSGDGKELEGYPYYGGIPKWPGAK